MPEPQAPSSPLPWPLTPLDDPGPAVALDTSGRLLVDGVLLDLTEAPPDREGALAVLFRLAVRPELLADLPEAPRRAHAAHLARSLLASGLQVPAQGPDKLPTLGLRALVLRSLQRLQHLQRGGEALAPALQSALADLAAGPDAPPQPLLRALLRRVGGLEQEDPEAAELLAALEALCAPAPTLGAHTLDPATARLYLGPLSCCRGPEALAALQAAHASFLGLSEEPGLSREAREALAHALEAYLAGSDTLVFQLGLWEGEARRAAAAVRHRRAVAPWRRPEGSLGQVPPRLGDLVLSEAQAAWLDGNLDLVRDAAAARRFAAGLTWARDLVPGEGPLAGTAFALFQRVHGLLRNRAEASEDGLLDYQGLVEELRRAAAELPERLPPLLASLAAPAPRFGHVDLDPRTAAGLRGLLRERVRSARSLANLEEALHAWATGSADPRDGVRVALDSEAGAAFLAFVEGYLATWPHLEVFDFNKLGRLALAEVTGDPVPLCRINGEAVDPGTFHVAVGEAVARGIPADRLPQPWMARRFGYRAKQCIELIDLLAEQQSRGLGPLPALFAEAARSAADGDTEARVRVVATTSDMFYNLLVFCVLGPDGAASWRYLDSQGALVARREPEDNHRLFEALLDESGHLDVQVREVLPTSPRAYPLQNPYGLGDRIDLELYDDDAVEAQVPEERFGTRYRVVQGTIVAYDAHGDHTVAFEHPEEGPRQRTLSYEDIRRQNNPHYVSETSGLACSARFRRDRDPRLAEDLEAMEAIARREGSVGFPLDLDELELARRQKAFLRALNAFTSASLRYPRKPPVDAADRRYWEVLDRGTHPMGDYLEVGRGVCRHQFIREHMGKQRGGIDERFASGAANTYGGDFRGLHIWGEVSLADRARLGHDNPEPRDTRYLSDATWADPYVPLWSGAYGNDARRVEMYDRTNYRAHLLVRS